MNQGPIHKLSLLLALLILGGCSSFMMTGGGGTYGSDASERTAAEVARDTTIVAEIKGRYVNDPVVGVFEVGVGSVNGRVTLTGTVGSYEARNQAYRIARGVTGVTAVINQIRVEDRSQ
jgi:hypothetical protein